VSVHRTEDTPRSVPGDGVRAVATTAAVRKRDVPVRRAEDGYDRLKRDVIVPHLQTLQAAIGANTVCLLKQDGEAEYHIEAIISHNAYARSQGHFFSKSPLIDPAQPRQPVRLLRVGEKGIPAKGLGYYIEPIAVRQMAVTTVAHRPTGDEYLLVADTMEDGGLATARQRTLLVQFAELLSTILDTREPAEVASDVPDMRPRRDIIAEEMGQARESDVPLGLALVYLNRAESVAEGGESAVAAAERVLEARLKDSLAEGRVERFGELTFGVFYPAPVADVEAWALQLQRDVASDPGLLAGGVSIGVAMLRDRHDGPDALRADATHALRESFETGSCIIIE
jgi:hypothetical protein